MKIKFLTDVCYPQNDPSQSRDHKAGDVYEGDADYCRRWIRRQVAVEVMPERKRKPEAMVPAPPATPVVEAAKGYESISAIRKAHGA